MDSIKDTNINHYLSDYLPQYYKRLFPFNLYYRWLNYGGIDKTYFSNREFSVTLENDVYIRYLSYVNQSELEKDIYRRIPYKIDIGAVYNFRPKDRFTISAFKPLYRELVFDIDISDYNDVRHCCQEANMCKKCWPLMTIAVKILERALRDDFGFKHILWIFSGRRGIHCWVCDESARNLEKNVRSAIAEYLSIVIGGEAVTRKVELDDPIHPSISRAFNIIKTYFEKLMLEDQDIMGTDEDCDKILSIIPDIVLCTMNKQLQKMIKKEINESVNSYKTSVDKWNIMSKVISRETGKGRFPKSSRCRQEIMLQYCYPRLDVNVTLGMNHLLKSPFSVHPKTGRVCVCMDPDNIDDFDFEQVPTISKLCEEINAYETNDDTTTDHIDGNDAKRPKVMKEYKKTSLYPSIQLFEKFVTKLETSWKGKLIEKSDMTYEF